MRYGVYCTFNKPNGTPKSEAQSMCVNNSIGPIQILMMLILVSCATDNTTSAPDNDAGGDTDTAIPSGDDAGADAGADNIESRIYWRSRRLGNGELGGYTEVVQDFMNDFGLFD